MDTETDDRAPGWDGFTVPTKYWHTLDDGRIQCDACPRACKLREGQRGVCFVRARLDDQVVLTSYGRSSGFFHEYAVDVADACHDAGVKAVAVTAGYVTEEPRREFYAHMDAANIDLKAFTEDFYRHTCGARLEAVKDTLRYVRHETPVWFEITNLLIPGLNDSDEELHAMTSWVVEDLGPDVPVHFTAFHPDFKLTDRPRTPPETLTRARRIAVGNGLQFAYTGNVHDTQGSSTYCPRCGNRVIERDWYALGDYRLADDGVCTACGHRMPGVFDGPPGGWGRRRLPVRLVNEGW